MTRSRDRFQNFPGAQFEPKQISEAPAATTARSELHLREMFSGSSTPETGNGSSRYEDLPKELKWYKKLVNRFPGRKNEIYQEISKSGNDV